MLIEVESSVAEALRDLGWVMLFGSGFAVDMNCLNKGGNDEDVFSCCSVPTVSSADLRLSPVGLSPHASAVVHGHNCCGDTAFAHDRREAERP